MKFKLRRYFIYYIGRVVAFIFTLLPLKVGPVVVDETKHYYDKDGNKVDIDLRPYLKSKEITEISVSL